MELKKVLGTGARAKVYKSDNYAIKLFNEGYSKKSIFYESLINSIIEESGLSIPKIYEVLNLGKQMAIKMDYLDGISLMDCIYKDSSNTVTYFEKMIKLHTEIHSKKVSLPFSFKNKLKNNIESNKKLNSTLKEKLLSLLSELPDGDALCHGDFHGYNILICNEKYWIIDWSEASYGPVECDVCRTYMIYHLHYPEMAEVYLSLYCKETNKDKEKILAWFPVVLASRLSESIPNEEEKIMELINSHLK